MDMRRSKVSCLWWWVGLLRTSERVNEGNGGRVDLIVAWWLYLDIPPSIFRQATVTTNKLARAQGRRARLVMKKSLGRYSELYMKRP